MENISQTGLMILLILSLLFHMLVILKIVPYKYVWGSRLKSDREMYRFEIISLVINAFLLLVVLVQANYLGIDISKNVLKTILWIMAGLFLLNTFGNIISKNKTEKYVFTPITFIMCIFSVILAVGD